MNGIVVTTGNADQARAFRGMFSEHYRRLFAYALRRTDTDADAQDVVAEVFTVAWRRFGELPEDPDEVRMWLYGTARRVVGNHHRSSRRHTELISRLRGLRAEAVLGPEVTDRVDEDLAFNALERLSSSDQEILLLAVWEEMPHREIAQILGTSTANVSVRLHRSKQRLRQLFYRLQDPDASGHVSDMETLGISRPDDER